MSIKFPKSEALSIAQLKEKTKYNDVLELNRHEYVDHVNTLFSSMKTQILEGTFVFLSPLF